MGRILRGDIYWADQIRTISTERLGKKIGRAKLEELEEVIQGLLDIIG